MLSDKDRTAKCGMCAIQGVQMTDEETGAIVDLPVHLNSSAVYCMFKLISLGLFSSCF